MSSFLPCERSFFACGFPHGSGGGFVPARHASARDYLHGGTGGLQNEKPMRKGVGVSGSCSQIGSPISEKIFGIGGRVKKKTAHSPLQDYARSANVSDGQGISNLVNTTKNWSNNIDNKFAVGLEV